MWIYDYNLAISTQKNKFENRICKMMTILLQPLNSTKGLWSIESWYMYVTQTRWHAATGDHYRVYWEGTVSFSQDKNSQLSIKHLCGDLSSYSDVIQVAVTLQGWM